MPPWLLALLVVVPLLGIGAAVGYVVTRDDDSEPTVRDDNARIAELRKRASSFEKDYQRVVKMIREEDPSAQNGAEALLERMQLFVEDFDETMRPYSDEEGYLKKEFEGYEEIKKPVLQKINDLAKQIGFGL